jgi:hypothetical protein
VLIGDIAHLLKRGDGGAEVIGRDQDVEVEEFAKRDILMKKGSECRAFVSEKTNTLRDERMLDLNERVGEAQAMGRERESFLLQRRR